MKPIPEMSIAAYSGGGGGDLAATATKAAWKCFGSRLKGAFLHRNGTQGLTEWNVSQLRNPFSQLRNPFSQKNGCNPRSNRANSGRNRTPLATNTA